MENNNYTPSEVVQTSLKLESWHQSSNDKKHGFCDIKKKTFLYFDQNLECAPTCTPSHLRKMSPESTPRSKNKWIDLEDGETNGLLVSFAVGMTIGSDRKKLSGPVGPSGSILFFTRCIYVTLFSRSIGHTYLGPVSIKIDGFWTGFFKKYLTVQISA